MIEMAFYHEVIECLKERCPCYPKEAQLITLCWDLACFYWTPLNTDQHPQREEGVSGSENIPTDTLAKPETQLSIISLVPVTKNKQLKEKSSHLVRNEAAARREQKRESEASALSVAEQSQEQEEEGNETINEKATAWFISLNNLWDSKNHFFQFPAKCLIKSCASSDYFMYCFSVCATRGLGLATMIVPAQTKINCIF